MVVIYICPISLSLTPRGHKAVALCTVCLSPAQLSIAEFREVKQFALEAEDLNPGLSGFKEGLREVPNSHRWMPLLRHWVHLRSISYLTGKMNLFVLSRWGNRGMRSLGDSPKLCGWQMVEAGSEARARCMTTLPRSPGSAPLPHGCLCLSPAPCTLVHIQSLVLLRCAAHTHG